MTKPSTNFQDLTDEYCAYLRKSRSDMEAEQNGAGETLARHKKLLVDTAQRMNIKISHFYSEVVSGDTIDERPVMQELLRSVEQGRWKGVLVVEVERLARGNTRDQGIVADAFKYSSTKIITPNKIYDPNNEFDEEYFEFGLFMSRREYKTINRRLQRGRMASLNEGNFIGSTPPFGYRKIKNTGSKGYTLEPIPEAFAIVRQIGDWILNGMLMPDGTCRKVGDDLIADRLTELNVPVPSSAKWNNPDALDNRSWTKSMVGEIATNITYAGFVFFGKRKYVKTVEDGILHKSSYRTDDFTMAKGKHTPVFTVEEFEQIQSLRKQNRKNTVPTTSVLQNPLSGLVYCSKCGRLMTRLGANSKNKYDTLKCPDKHCSNVSSPMFLIENKIIEFLEKWLQEYTIENNDTNNTEDTLPLRSEIKSKETAISKLDKELETIKKQQTKTYELLEQEVYTIEIFKERKQALDKELTDKTAQKEQLLKDIASLKLAIDEKESFIPRVRYLLDTYKNNTPAINNELLKDLISKITYEKETPNHRGTLTNANFTLNIYPRISSR